MEARSAKGIGPIPVSEGGGEEDLVEEEGSNKQRKTCKSIHSTVQYEASTKARTVALQPCNGQVLGRNGKDQ